MVAEVMLKGRLGFEEGYWGLFRSPGFFPSGQKHSDFFRPLLFFRTGRHTIGFNFCCEENVRKQKTAKD
jgi:hypothetical protein